MNFHSFRPIYEHCRRRRVLNAHRLKALEWYGAVMQMPRQALNEIVYGGGHSIEADRQWISLRRPYYSLFPAIQRALLKVPLNIPCQQVRMPLDSIAIEFMQGHELRGEARGDVGDRTLRALLCHQFESEGKRYLGIHMDYEGDDCGRRGLWFFPLMEGTVEDAVNRTSPSDDSEIQTATPEMIQAVRLAIGLSLMHDDPTLVERDVLADDREKYLASKDLRYVEKAERRGKVGWLVGAHIETMPHVRRPHLALRWTGVGRTVPRIVAIGATVVHRSKLTEVPTGYHDNEESRYADKSQG